MISDFPVMVDACVLVQAAVRDTLLRLFERRLFLARWTDEIIEETVRTLQGKLDRTNELTDRLVNELREHFPDAWVEQGYRESIPAMTNQSKDRHVRRLQVRSGYAAKCSNASECVSTFLTVPGYLVAYFTSFCLSKDRTSISSRCGVNPLCNVR
jgi:hypothetical protein